MINQHPALPGSTITMPTTPVASMKPEITFSDDEYESFTYKKWFERHTGLSLDEAITLGLATREYLTRWKTVRSLNGLWHLSYMSTP